MTYEKGKV
jgi:intraflagellar transport protein 172